MMYMAFFIIVAMITYGALLFFSKSDEEKRASHPISDEGKRAEEREFKPIITEETFKGFTEENLNPFGEAKPVAELESKDYANYLHGMVHQKVSAEEKWIFYEMHQERIDWLLESLKNSSVPNTDIYTEILTRWQQGDFSQAVEDHNLIWELQDGNIGKAKRLLNGIEEEAFVEEMYRIKGD